MAKLILASASPARLELLKSAGIVPSFIMPADIDETPIAKELPQSYVLRVANAKAEAVAAKEPNAIILAADTIAVIGRTIIGKADTVEEARKTLKKMSGRRHRVYTAVAIKAPNRKMQTKRILTTVKFKHLEKDELEKYLASDAWRGKSGCYGIGQHGGAFVEWINGSFSSVIGLPLVETLRMLKSAGYQ